MLGQITLVTAAMEKNATAARTKGAVRCLFKCTFEQRAADEQRDAGRHPLHSTFFHCCQIEAKLQMSGGKDSRVVQEQWQCRSPLQMHDRKSMPFRVLF